MAVIKPFPPGQFGTIVVDPPWPYEQELAGSRVRGGVPYPVLTIEEIIGLDVGRLAAPDCQCWLWTTNSHLHYAFHALEAWGFEYKTMVTWVKTSFGLGYWLRGQTEHALLGIRGNPRQLITGPHGATGSNFSTVLFDLVSRWEDLSPVVIAKRGQHSEKPEAFMDMVEQISPPPRIELFARRRRMGWEVWGDEV